MPLKATKAIAQQLVDEVSVVAELAIDDVWTRMVNEAVGEFARLSRQGLSDDEMLAQIQHHLEGLSTKTEEVRAREAVSVIYNEGRAAEMEDAALSGEVGFAVRSEVLDHDTCATCASLDGTVVEIGTPEFDELMPPALCDGGDRCRGFYIVVGDEQSRSAAA